MPGRARKLRAQEALLLPAHARERELLAYWHAHPPELPLDFKFIARRWGFSEYEVRRIIEGDGA